MLGYLEDTLFITGRSERVNIQSTVWTIIDCLQKDEFLSFLFSITPEGYHETLAVTALHPKVTPFKGVVVEVWLTFMLVLTIFGATHTRKAPFSYPSLPIGLVVAMDILAGVSYKW